MTSAEPIAIVGLSGRYPGGANNPSLLWSLLQSGRSGVSAIPSARWERSFFHPRAEHPGKIPTQAGGWLEEDVDLFDAAFFGISPREASRIDPQQRLLLRLAWECMEDAGETLSRVNGRPMGVFVGVSGMEYSRAQYECPSSINAYTNAGAAMSIAANRISYFFDLRGPSLVVDTACSSSLVALHLARESILRGESTAAFVAGVNMLLRPEPSVGFAKASMLSPSGCCHSFDKAADGYIRAEGGGVLMLKSLSQAVSDGNHIYALIRGSGVNSDGRTNGLSLPNEFAQEALIRTVYANAGIDPKSVFYVEAHGTGTPAGDPIECRAIGRSLGKNRNGAGPCLIGSVKSNIGHMEPASGIAGITKILLALRHREIPGMPTFRDPNPSIPFADLGLEVVARNRALPERSEPLLMGVNSFGFGGTNAHVILQEYREARSNAPAPSSPQGTSDPSVLCLSAKTLDALNQSVRTFPLFLRQSKDRLPDLCATAALRRDQHEFRLAVWGHSHEEIARKLESAQPTRALNHSTRDGKVAFVFTGNGPQWWAMGRQLLQSDAASRTRLQEIDRIFQPQANWSLAAEFQRSEPESRMHLTEVAQPTLFALQVIVSEWLMKRGLQPDMVIGHSVGEIAAAYISSHLTLEDAVRVVLERSRLQERTAGTGKMAAVGFSPAEAAEALQAFGNRLELAAINSPISVTIAGAEDALKSLEEKVLARGKFYRLLPLNYPFHSRSMDPLQRPILTALQKVESRAGTIPMISTVTGEAVRAGELDADYWWRNIRQPVQFAGAVQRLIDGQVTAFVEIGPHPALRVYLNETATKAGIAAGAIPTLQRGEPEIEKLWNSICQCQNLGYLRRPEQLFPAKSRLVALPHYPWQLERHWNPTPQLTQVVLHPLNGKRLAGPQPVWQHQVDPESPAFLADHVVRGSVVFPAAGYIEMAATAAQALSKQVTVELDNVEIHQAMVLQPGRSELVQLSVAEDNTFRISSQSEENAKWITRVTGRIGVPAAQLPADHPIAELKQRMPRRVPAEEIYRVADVRGISYGPTFRRVVEVFIGTDEALGVIGGAELAVDNFSPFLIDPTRLDACFQSAIGLFTKEQTFLPVRFESFQTFGRLQEVTHCHVEITHHGVRSLKANFRLLDDRGRVLGLFNNFRFQAVELAKSATGEPTVVQQKWHEQSLPGQRARVLIGPKELAATVQPRLKEYRGAEAHGEVHDRFDRLCVIYASNALHRLGFAGKAFTLDHVIREGGVLEIHRRLVARLLEITLEGGATTRDGSGYRLQTPGVSDSLPLWREIALRDSSCSTELQLLARCGENLTDVLLGKIDPLELIFSESRSKLVEDIYDSAPVVAIYNALMRDLVAEIVASLGPTKTLRILEAGAGTGGMTAHLLPLLPRDRTEYLFTDVSPIFLGKAKERFKAYPFVRYGTLDVSTGRSDSPLAENSFDLVIAANVVHATAHLRAAIGHLHKFLAPGGLLLLLEKHDEHIADMIFGLLKGWWAFDDLDLRQTSPLLSAERWTEVLRTCGFEDPAVFSDGAILKNPQHSVLVARKPELSPATVTQWPASGKRWLVLHAGGAGGDVATAALAAIRSSGDPAIEVSHGAEFQRHAPDRFTLDLTNSEAVAKLCQTLKHEGIEAEEVVHLAGFKEPALKADPLSDQPDFRCLSCVLLVQGLLHSVWSNPPRLWLVTASAWTSNLTCGAAIVPAQASLWGIGRVLKNEHPEFKSRLVDLHLEGNASEMTRLFLAELAHPSAEDEVLLENRSRFVLRAEKTPISEARSVDQPTPDVTRETPYELVIESQGVLEGLKLRPAKRRQPSAGEVEIRVRASGLNFRDLMWAMNMLPAEALENGFTGPTLGMECAGEITAVGAGVTGLKAGDEVIAFGQSTFASHVVTNARAVLPKPPHLLFSEAATICSAFITALYSLQDVAQLRRGERVVIHGATGGVGLAAIQVANQIGAIVFATAGTDEKRNYLRSLGVPHVLNSRSLDFAAEIMQITSNEGIDVVLNSISGEVIHKNLSILRPFGRFIEIGKRDFYADSKIGLRPFAKNLSYFGIDADQLLALKPHLAQDLMTRTLEFFRMGVFHPLPHRDFPLPRATEAFRYMQHSRQIGKVVLTQDETTWSAVTAPKKKTERRPLKLSPDSSYLVTGGLGGFGLATAKWLVSRGARHLALASRRGAAAPEADAALRELRAQGVNVHAFAIDVADENAVETLLRKTLPAQLPPLRGIFHAAMVLDDAAIFRMTDERLQRVMNPKIKGALNLHRHTQDIPLDFFVLYSSAMTLAGNSGQSNYAAANMYLESLAWFRRARGLPALAVSWGGITGTGYLSRNEGKHEVLQNRLGLRSYTTDEALAQLEQLLQSEVVHTCAVEFDFAKWRKTAPAALSAMFSRMDSDEKSNEKLRDDGLLERLLAMPAAERLPLVQQRVIEAVATISGTSAAKLDLSMPPSALGLDSLMMVELTNQLSAELKTEVPVMQLIQATSLDQIARILIKLVKMDVDDPAAASAPASVPKTNATSAEKVLPH